MRSAESRFAQDQLAYSSTDGFRGVQAQLGELVAWRSLFWAITTALCTDPTEGPGGAAIPKLENAVLVRLFGTFAWPRVREVCAQSLGGSPLVVPSSHKDLQNEELRPLIDRFYRGSTGSAEDRTKLFNLLWDAVGSEFGSRHEFYERNYGGNHEQVRLDALRFAGSEGLMGSFKDQVEQCMSEYDLDGWTGDTWAFGATADRGA